MNSNKRVLMIVGAVVLLVALVFGLTMLLGGDDDDTADSGATAATEAGSDSGPGAGETRFVKVTGAALDPHDPGVEDTAVGTAAPILDGEDFGGEPLAIGADTDNPTLVAFLAHWCPHCNAEAPRLIQLKDEGVITDDLDVVAVSTAVDPTGGNYPPSQWFESIDWPWPTMADDDQSSAFTAYGGQSFPYLVMLDADGTVVARQAGESSVAELQTWIDANTP